MKFKLSTLLLLPTLLFGFASCGGKNTSSAKLKITHGFAMTNPYFAGGLIVIAENLTLGKKISISLDSSKETNVELEKGVWNFAAMGWDGGIGDQKFKGNQFCGFTQSNISSDQATVDLTINTAGCMTAAFQSAFDVKSFIPKTCGALYKFTSVIGGSDTFAPIDSDNFCNSMPEEFKTSYTHYKISAVNFTQANPSPGFSSGCEALAGATRFNLPVKKFPFVIKIFKSPLDCSLDFVEHMKFTFPNGLALGNPQEFDHHFSASGLLALSSNDTQKGFSPFMSMLPRIKCANGDCFRDANSNVKDLFVRWMDGGDNRAKTIVKNTNETTCPPELSNMKYFNLRSCQIEERQLKVQVGRNKLTCGTIAFSAITDLYFKNNLYYALFGNKIEVLSADGKNLHTLNLGTPAQKITVDETGNIFIAYSGFIGKIPYDAGTKQYLSLNPTFLSLSPLFISNVFDIEATANAFYIAGVKSGQKKIYAFHLSSGATLGETSDQFTDMAKSLKAHGTHLYLLQSNGGASSLLKASDNPMSMGSLINVSNYAYSQEGFWINMSGIYTIRTTGEIKMKTLAYVDVSTFPTAVTNPSFLVAVGNNLYLKGPSLFHTFERTPVLTEIGASDTCSESVAFTMDSNPYNLDFKTKSDDSIYRIFNDGLDFIGVTQISDAKSKTFFEALNHDGDDPARSGGPLGSIREMLGPTAIGGLLSEFSSCSEVFSRASADPTKSFNARKIFYRPGTTEWFDANLTVSSLPNSGAGSIPIDPFTCEDNDPSGFSCNEKYDILLNFVGVDSDGRNETTKIYLECGRQLGSYETLEVEPSRTSRNLFLWNTGDPSGELQRFEEYSTDDEPSRKYASLTKLSRAAGDGLWVRKVSAEINGASIWGNALELHRESGYIKTSAYHMQDGASTFLTSNGQQNIMVGPNAHSFEDARDSTDFYSLLETENPAACMSEINQNVEASNNYSCDPFTSISPYLSRGTMPLSIQQLIESGGTNIHPDLLGVFTITP